MSAMVGTSRAGSNRTMGSKGKSSKAERSSQSANQAQHSSKSDGITQNSKLQPTQEQLRLAQITDTKSDVDEAKLKQLMEMTGKSEDVVAGALHDANNDADTAVMMLLEGGEGEWQEQSAKKKKKATAKDGVENHVDDKHDGRVNGRMRSRGEKGDRHRDRGDKDRNDRDRGERNRADRDHENHKNDRDEWEREQDEERDSFERNDRPPRRGRRNDAYPPRLARGRGRERGGFFDRNRDRGDRMERENEDWDNDRIERGPFRGDRERSGGERGRGRGRGGFGPRRGGVSGRGRFNSDRENRNFNRVPRFEKLHNSHNSADGPEIDTWTNETAENAEKDAAWGDWTETWGNEENSEDQWTGSLEETKVFTPSTMKSSMDSEAMISEPPSSLGQRLDVDSLFSKSAEFTKAPDFTKPAENESAYITQFNQAATETIKNTIGIGSSSRQQQQLGSLSSLSQAGVSANALGLSSLAGNSGQTISLQQTPSLAQLSQSLAQSVAQSQSQSISSHLPAQSQTQSLAGSREEGHTRLPPGISQPASVISVSSTGIQQRPKPQRSKLPPPSKIPSTAVEMPGHMTRMPHLDVQFGADSSPSLGLGGSDSPAVTSAYSSTPNVTSSVISNHLSQVQVSQSTESSMSSTMKASPSAGSSAAPPMPNLDPASGRAVFQNSVYNTPPPKNEPQALDRDQNKMTGHESIPYPNSLERKTSPLVQNQRQGNQTTQPVPSGAMQGSKADGAPPSGLGSFSSNSGYSSSYHQNHKPGSNSGPPSAGGYQSQYQASQFSAPPQGQYPSGQPQQFPPGQGQFASSHHSSHQTPFSGGQSGFNSGQAYQSAYQAQAFQSHSSSSQASAQNSLYPNTTQPGAYPGPPQGSSSSSSYPAQVSSSASYPSQGPGSYPSVSSSYPSHPAQGSASNSSYPSQSGGSSYPGQGPSASSSFPSQGSSFPSGSSSSYHGREGSGQAGVSTATNQPPMSYPGPQPSQPPPSVTSLKSGASQSGPGYSGQTYNAGTSGAPSGSLQPSQLANKLGESLSKMSLKDSASLDSHQSSQYEHSSTSSTTASLTISSTTAPSSSLSTSSNTITSLSTTTTVTASSRAASLTSTSKAPPNLPPGVPVMGTHQYIMGQGTMPPFFSLQQPVYGYEDVQLLQQRMPLQTGSFYDMGGFPAPSTHSGRDQPPLASVPFTGAAAAAAAAADASKLPRVDAQSPNASSQPQSSHSAQQPVINYHYGYYYPSMFPGAAGIQYPMFPMPPVTNTATPATTQFQKTFATHTFTGKGYEELNQAQDFSKAGYGSMQAGGPKGAGSRMSNSQLSHLLLIACSC